MADLVTISSLITGVGTLALALATFSSVRAANRSAKASEQALQISNRPLLISSHIYDPAEKFKFIGTNWIKLEGGHGYAHATEDVIYFAISVRNIGQGVAVLDQWSFTSDPEQRRDIGDLSTYRRLTRDLYVPGGGLGFWQGTIRDPQDWQFQEAAACIIERRELTIRVEYSDQEGGQRTVTLFGLSPTNKKDDWLAAAGRHWRLDGPDPRTQG